MKAHIDFRDASWWIDEVKRFRKNWGNEAKHVNLTM